MFCSNCGKEQQKGAEFCPECGASLKSEVKQEKKEIEEGSTFGWGVLGFFFPLVGLILFLVWRIDRPKASKSSGIGALIGFCGSIIVSIMIGIMAVVFGYNDIFQIYY